MLAPGLLTRVGIATVADESGANQT